MGSKIIKGIKLFLERLWVLAVFSSVICFGGFLALLAIPIDKIFKPMERINARKERKASSKNR